MTQVQLSLSMSCCSLADCHVIIADDALWEGPELLQVIITSSDPTIQTIHIENQTANITIVDPEDG